MQPTESVQRNVSYQIPGLTYQKVPGDGHCLFHAVGLYVNQDQAFLRRIVAAHLEHNKNKFRQSTHLRAGQTIENYIQAIRNGEELADNIEIEVLMTVLDRPIVVIGPDLIIRNQEVLEKKLKGEPIFVLYNGHDHYDAFLRVEGTLTQDIIFFLTQSKEHSNEIVEYTLSKIANRAPVIDPKILKCIEENPDISNRKQLTAGSYGAFSLPLDIYKFKDSYVIEGEKIGSGAWCDVYICRQYTHEKSAWKNKICVIKKLKNKNVFHYILNHISDIHKKMKLEADYEETEYLEIETNEIIVRFEFAGDCLTNFLDDEKILISSLTASQWLEALISLTLTLEHKHTEKEIMHADIKPDNICIKIEKALDTPAAIKLKLIDWASAHKIATFGAPGDIRYQPYESYWFFGKLKNQKTDVFCLGKTYLYILEKIDKNILGETVFVECEALFKKMCSALQDNRPRLSQVTVELIQIKFKCDASAVESPNHTIYKIPL